MLFLKSDPPSLSTAVVAVTVVPAAVGRLCLSFSFSPLSSAKLGVIGLVFGRDEASIAQLESRILLVLLLVLLIPILLLLLLLILLLS